MKRLLLVGLLVLSVKSNFTFAQSSFIPQNLGENINTVYNEINPVLSPDGKTIYFSRINHPENNYGKYESQDVWFSELQANGTWGPASRLNNFINASKYNALMGISADGKKILISGRYSKSKKWIEAGISMVTKFKDEWSIPERVNIPKLQRYIKGRSFNATISSDGTYILLAGTRRWWSKSLDLFVTKDEGSGTWSKPISLGNVINTTSSEESPYLLSNNEILYFSSNRAGSYDIYFTERKSNTWEEWTEPKRLNDTINSPAYESYFKTNKSGTIAYFASSNKTFGGTDIYKVKLKEDLPFVILSGRIVNRKTNKPVITSTGYSIYINGKKSDSTTINYDSALYKTRLKFGKSYTLEARVKNFVPELTEFDATNIKEYTEDKRDLYVTPLPYALIKGTFIVKSTGMIVPPIANAKLFVDADLSDNTLLNSSFADSAKIDISKASYSIKLPYGKKYILMVNASKYIGQPDTLDLTNVDEYQEIVKPLYAEREKELVFTAAVIAGKVINKKTTKPLTGTAFSINVDKVPGAAYVTNTLTGEYSISIPLGNSYVINAQASGFYPIYEPIDVTNDKTNVRVLKDLVVVPIQVGQAVRINNIFFETGKSILNPKSFPELDKLAKFLIENPNIMVEIAGHTDNVGKPDNNMKLSRWRARAVEQYLESKGVIPTQVGFNGYGHTKPVANNKTPKGKALNRRVEFVIKEVK